MSAELTRVDYLNGMIKSGNLDQLFRVLNEDQPCWPTPGAKFIETSGEDDMPGMSGVSGHWEIDATLRIEEINRRGPRTGKTLFETAMAHPQESPDDQRKVLEVLEKWGAVLPSPPMSSPASSVSISPEGSPRISLVLPLAPSHKDKDAGPLKVELLFRLPHVPGDELGKRLASGWRGGLGTSGAEESTAGAMPPRQARAFMGLAKLGRKPIDPGADPLG